MAELGRAAREHEKVIGGSPANSTSGRWWCALVPVALAVLVYLPSINGQWVYDDLVQIVANPLVYEDHLVGKALTSDVWGFQGGTEQATSRYWRPTFVLWMIVNERLFGMQHTAGWHAHTILWHALAVLAAFVVMRRAGMSRVGASVGATLFALHPTKVSSVAWVSGATDPLMAAPLLASLAVVMRLTGRGGDSDPRTVQRRTGIMCWMIALLLYVMALGAKEVAIVMPALVFVATLAWRLPRDGEGSGGERIVWRSVRKSALYTAPFAVTAAAWMLLRSRVLGPASGPPMNIEQVLLTVPLLGAVYVRQAFFPLWLSVFYPFRPVTAKTLGPSTFFGPMLLVVGAGLVMVWAALGRKGCGRSRPALIGVAVFVCTLAPAVLAAGVVTDQMVQDRYLYLPLLGLLMILVPEFERAVARRPRLPRQRVTAVVGALLAIPLAAQTILFSAAWSSDLALWTWTVKRDPSSVTAWNNLGAALLEMGRFDDAAAPFDRAVKIDPLRGGLGRARVAIEQAGGALARAEAAAAAGDQTGMKRLQNEAREHYALAEGLLTIMYREFTRSGSWGRVFDAADLLARVWLERDDDVARSIDLYRDAWEYLPAQRAVLSDRIGMVLEVDGQIDAAIAALEAGRPYAKTEVKSESRRLFFRLGALYAHTSRHAEARAALQEFLDLTTDYTDPGAAAMRDQARQILNQLGPGGNDAGGGR
ncbi:MAG: tetratricopeptide repeat protein [Phycisphaerales bacterium]|nr:tetratricopeptide repeat protein [Phycisphaerales bacterium]